MQPATVAGIPGAAWVRSRRRSEASLEYRGVFAFGREQEAALVELLASREVVEYVGTIGDEPEPRHMKVRLTDISLEGGLAYFQGLGEPYDESRGTRAG